MASVKVLSATLLANHNTVQVTDSVISNSSIFEIYVSDPDLICNNIVVGGTTANITFDSKPTSNTPIKVLVNNIDGNFTVNASDVVSGTTNQDAINTSVSSSISTLSSSKVDTTTLNERVPSETVLGGVLYHGTTGNEWKVLSGSNVNYDSNNTINEKVTNIDGRLTSVESSIATTEDITSTFFNMASGYTLLNNYSSIIKVGKCIIGNVIIKKDSDFQTYVANTMCSINRNLYNVKNFRCYGMLSINSYSIASVFGYVSVNGDNIETWLSNSGMNHIRFDFVTYIQD